MAGTGWIVRVPRKDGASSFKACYRDPGKRIRTKTFRRKRDASAYLASMAHSINAGAWHDPQEGKVTVEELWRHFERTSAGLAPSTMALYEAQARNHILPHLGHLPIRSVTKATVKEFLADLRASGVGPASVAGTYRLLRRLLNVAVDEGRIPSNPAAKISLGSAGPEKEIRFLTAQEVQAIAGEVADVYRALVLFLAYTGARIGEAAALRVKNVDLMRGRVTISGASVEVNGEQFDGPTKTRRKRTVTLPAFLAGVLTSHLAAYSQPEDSDARVFVNSYGDPIRQSSFRKNVFQPAARRVGIDPPPRVHDLRHTAVALAIQGGLNTKQIQEMLGHATPVMTLQRYAHLYPMAHEEGAAKLDALYRSANVGSVIPLAR